MIVYVLVGKSITYQPCYYLCMAYSDNPLLMLIAVNVPIHPLNFLSAPVFHVTNKGLLTDNITLHFTGTIYTNYSLVVKRGTRGRGIWFK